MGTGRVADQALAPALREVPGAVLWSVLSRDRDRARAFADRHGARAPVPAHARLDEMLGDPSLDAVIVATPDRLHAEQARAALRAGKHVWVEKPMATDLDDARALVAESRGAGLRLAVGYHMRWHAAHREVARRCREGELGALRHLRVHWSGLAPNIDHWRRSPALARWWSLSALGTHGLDQILWLMEPTCGELVELKGVVDHSVHGGPHDETVVLGLRFASGATAELCCSVAFAAPTRMEVYGARGYAICEGTFGLHGGGSLRNGPDPVELAPVNPFAAALADFTGAIAARRDPEVTGEVGVRNLAVMLRAVPGTAADPARQPGAPAT